MKYIMSAALLGLLSIAPCAQAQKFTNPFGKADKYTIIGAMASIPSGQFRSTDLKDGGYASTGWGLYFDSKTVLKSGLYFVSHSTYSWVPLNIAALNTSFTKELGKASGYNVNSSSTSVKYNDHLRLEIYNDAGSKIYSETRSPFGSSMDSYRSGLDYMVKRTPYGSKHK